MSNKALYGIVAGLIVVGVILYVYSNQQAQAPTVENTTNTAPTVTETPANTPANTAAPTNTPRLSDESDVGGEVQTYLVTYTSAGFSPGVTTIKNGDIVVFRNNSGSAFWPASGPHPQHTNYPEFDAKAGIASGSSFQFKFTRTGTWGYHDHLNATRFGQIIVQ